jgi:hypothetical protein
MAGDYGFDPLGLGEQPRSTTCFLQCPFRAVKLDFTFFTGQHADIC